MPPAHVGVPPAHAPFTSHKQASFVASHVSTAALPTHVAAVPHKQAPITQVSGAVHVMPAHGSEILIS